MYIKSKIAFIIAGVIGLSLVGCKDSQTEKDRANVAAQQATYATAQPIPVYDWSLERQLVIELLNARNSKVATHAVWRSDTGMITGDCASIGFGIPYDVSLTNPLKAIYGHQDSAVAEQPEPNGIFASKNTNATWVMCTTGSGQMMPVYTEDHVTVYPSDVDINYKTGRVVPKGIPSVVIKGD